MDTKIFIWVSSVIVVLSFYSCDPAQSSGEWYVTNNFNDTIFCSVLKDADDNEAHRLMIVQKKTEQIIFRVYYPVRYVSFYSFNNGRYSIFRVYDKKGELLREWHLSEQNDNGKQFFNENSWHKKVEDKGKKLSRSVWTFTINEDDLIPE